MLKSVEHTEYEFDLVFGLQTGQYDNKIAPLKYFF